jgi:hypothetical protein
MTKWYLISYKNKHTFAQCNSSRFFCPPDSQFVFPNFVNAFLYIELNGIYGRAVQDSLQRSGVMNDAALKTGNSMTCEKSCLAQNLTNYYPRQDPCWRRVINN